MAAGLLVAALAAASPVPRSLPNADFAVHAPRLGQVATLRPFLERAGDKAILLRPQSWQSELHPLFIVDPTRPESLTAAGIAADGPATVSARGGLRLSCLHLADPQRFEERARSRLSALGTPWKGKGEGKALVGAAAGGKVVAAYAVKGREVCTVAGPGMSDAEAAEAVRALKRGTSSEWKLAAGAPGPVKVLWPGGFAGLAADARALTGEGRLIRQPLPALRGGGPSPYAGMAPQGLAFLRARVDPSAAPALVEGLRAQVLQLCPDCDAQTASGLARALAPLLSGNLVARVEKVKVSESLRSPAGRFFALRHAYLAELSRPEEAKKLLGALAHWRNARALGDGHAVQVRGGEVLIGARGPHLYLANDEQVLADLFAALPASPGKLEHGAELVVDPRRVARGLGQIPLLDVLGSQELAALFAVGTELGPLLAVSERLEAWADPAGPGAHAFSASWRLPPLEAADAGSP